MLSNFQVAAGFFGLKNWRSFFVEIYYEAYYWPYVTASNEESWTLKLKVNFDHLMSDPVKPF